MTQHTLTYADVAKAKQVSTKTVKRWVAAGRLGCLRIGRVVRFSPTDVAGLTDTPQPAVAETPTTT